MHDPVIQNLEAYLEGRHVPQLESHIRSCEGCQSELAYMTQHSDLLRTLKVTEELQPAWGFYGRVAARIESQEKTSFWDLLLDPIFGRRLVYATAALVMLMSGYLAFAPAGTTQVSFAPERMLAAPPPNAAALVGQDAESDRNVVLVDMVSFSQAD